MTARERYRERKPIRVRSEDSLSESFSKRLVREGWDYKPRFGGFSNAGGHWVPPGYRTIPSAATHDHGKRFLKAALKKRL